MIAFVNIRLTRNTGDLMSSPALWFDWPEHVLLDIRDPLPSVDVVVYGGGTLTGWLRSRSPAPPKRIAWGIGSTRRDADEPCPDPEGFHLVGVREYRQGHAYAPCASCMSPLFDREYRIKQEAVLFVNADPSRPAPAVRGLPAMDNTRSMAEIVAFLGSAATVVTNSYHGAYWATLLGRAVVCVPYSSKFLWFQHRPALSRDGRDWREFEPERYPEALEECRTASRTFYRRALEIIE